MAEINCKKLSACFLIGLLLTIFTFNEKSFAAYSDSYVISDYTFTKTDTMSAEDINNFFRDYGGNGPSWLYNYVIGATEKIPYPIAIDGIVESRTIDVPQTNGVTSFGNQRVADLIYKECQEHKINPQVFLAILEKESSAMSMNCDPLVSGHDPSSHTADDFKIKHPVRIAWPIYYMYDERMTDCLNGDASKCSDPGYLGGGPYLTYENRTLDFGGVGQQIAYAAYSLQKNYNIFLANPNLYGNTYCNGSSCNNAGTRVLYNYTPHAQTNFYNVFSGWFGDPTYTPSAPDAPPARKSGDANSDNAIDSTDLSILADQWGKNVSANTGADYNGDGIVDSTDLSILADAWGK